jgi:hypothetical protein
MPLATRVCLLADCDFCDDGGWDEYTPHFESVAEAISYAEQAGWRIVGHLVWCPTCASRADCRRLDHKWVDDDGQAAPWSQLRTDAGVPFRTRHCWHCWHVEYDPPFVELVVLDEAAHAAADGLNPETPG